MEFTKAKTREATDLFPNRRADQYEYRLGKGEVVFADWGSIENGMIELRLPGDLNSPWFCSADALVKDGQQTIQQSMEDKSMSGFDDESFKFWKDGESLCASCSGENRQGDLIEVRACIDLRKLSAEMGNKVKGKDALYISKAAIAVARGRLKKELAKKWMLAEKNKNRPAQFMGSDPDYAKIAQQGIPVVVDVLSMVYPGLGVALKLVDSASKGDGDARQEIKDTHAAAKQGDPNAQIAAKQLQIAAKTLQEMKDSLSKNEYSKSVEGPKKTVKEVRGLYALGIMGRAV